MTGISDNDISTAISSSCLCLGRKDYLADMPRLDCISLLDNVPNLSNTDTDNNVLSDINFDYYFPYEFYNDMFVKNSLSNNPFSVFHCNVRSLSANYDSLMTLLADVQHSFSVIGLSRLG